MDDTGLPPLPSAPNATPIVPESVVPAPADNETLPPLPVPSDTVKSRDTVTPTSPPPSPEATVGHSSATEGHDNDHIVVKKKSNMKVVVGMVVALFLVGASIAVSVLFPGFRGDLRQRASYGEPECYSDNDCGTVALVCRDGSCVPNSAAPTAYCSGDMRDCAFGCTPSLAGGFCNEPTTTATVTSSYECQGGTRCNSGRSQSCISFRWVDNGNTCGGGTSSGGGECTEPDTQCIDTYMQRCSGGQWYDTQQRCGGTGGQTGSCTQLGTTCVCNTCHRDGFNSATGYMCNSTGTEFDVTRKCDMPDSGTCGTNTNCEIQTCGCLNTGEASAGETGPYHCWVKNGTTGAWIREIGETIPNKLGCKGSGTPSVTTSVTASVTTGGGSSSGGSSSSSSGGSSSSSSGGTAPLCVETRVYLKKADGTFDTVATPVSQLSSKVSIGNTIRLAIRGNLANFTKGRFIIKKGSTVLETKETTTKNNLPGDPATFEFVYDYTVASGGSYSIEGAVWQ